MEKEKILIYQILPRLFGNDSSTSVVNGNIEENGCGKLSAFSEKALREIRAMGFNHIWYTGVIEHATQTDYSGYGIPKDHPAIVKGKAGSPYAIKDYYDIDPDLAHHVTRRMTEFEALIERSHQAGLKVIIDFVPNHVARQYHSDAKPSGVEDLGSQDKPVRFDTENNFYYIPGEPFAPHFPLESNGDIYTEFPAKATGNDCFSPHPGINDWYETIKLNYGVDYWNGRQKHFSPIPATWKQMAEILFFWSSKGVDGFRCDMAEMVPVEFWNWTISQIKQKYPALLFIAEVYNPEEYRNYLETGRFDFLYDKVGLYDILKEVIRGSRSTQAITGCWQSLHGIQTQMLNFLENHDEQRIASSFFAQDPWKALPALVVSATLHTNPFMVYFGQELGEPGMDAEGFSGCDGRTTIFDYWSIPSVRNWRNRGKYNEELLTDIQKQLRKYYIRLLRFCNESKAIREGLFYDLMYVNGNKDTFNAHRHYAFMRYHEDELLLIVANFDTHTTDIHIHIPVHAYEYFGLQNFRIQSAIDWLTDRKYPVGLSTDTDYIVSVGAYESAIIQFKLSSP